MKEVIIFYGSKIEFEKIIPNYNVSNLTKMVMELDADSKTFTLQIENKPEKDKVKVENFVVESSEYAGVREHVILNFANFIAKMEVENMYLHNPPLSISNQMVTIFPQIKIINQPYKRISALLLQEFDRNYSTKILGQENVKRRLLQALYPLISERQLQPITVLFFGDTGLGKTETANYICDLLEEKLFRKQFSMFQNNQFATYLFGGAHCEMSFAKDLLDRESNVILLDEFDKANSTFHSAFYQLFDEGVYVDQNYYVKLERSIIICTSNYKSKDEIKKHLGNAIFSRFDAVIKFDALTNDVKRNICRCQIEEQLQNYSPEEIAKLGVKNIKDKLVEISTQCDNAREINHLIKDTFSQILLDAMLSEDL